MKTLIELSAAEIARKIAAGDLAPTEIVQACLDQIATYDTEVAAWTHVDADGARVTARERETEARAGRLRGPLHGVPVAIKDVINVAGMTTTCGAGSFAHFNPDADAACVARLRDAGAIILGKVTTTEFAYFEPSGTRNPWNTAHTPGGSSSGSAAAVAARMAPIALGSQTIGSVLRPAAYCGVIGFKGTHGAVPMDGSFPLARSLDHIGVFARASADARLVFDVLTGRSSQRSAPQPPRIALVPELVERASPDVSAQIRATVERLASAGAQVTEVRLPQSFATIHAAGQVVLESEFATYQEDLFRNHVSEYRPRTRGLIEAGLAQRAVPYVKAQQARARFRDDMAAVFATGGILLTPTAQSTAPKGLGFTGDPWFCAPWSSIGVPALSLPTAVGLDNLPHAIQLIAPSGADDQLFDAASWCEGVIKFSIGPVMHEHTASAAQLEAVASIG